MHILINKKVYHINEYTNEYIYHGDNSVDIKKEDVTIIFESIKGLLYIKNNFNEIDNHWVNYRLFSEYLSICEYYFAENKYADSLAFFVKAALKNPKIIVSRWWLGKIKLLIIKKNL
jgi:hypothetical protein